MNSSRESQTQLTIRAANASGNRNPGEVASLVELYNAKNYGAVYSKVKEIKSNQRTWAQITVTLLAILRLIADDPGAKTLGKHKRNFQRLLIYLIETEAIGKDVSTEALVKPAIYAAIIFVINKVGENVHQRTDNTGTCNIFFNSRNKHLTEKLIIYGEILHFLYEQFRIESLSYATLFVCTLADRLNQKNWVPVEADSIESHIRYHRAKCKSEKFKEQTELRGSSINLTFWTKPFHDQMPPALTKLNIRSLGFRLGG